VAEAPKYWFPAKRYGYGWGLPLCWQGWIVFALFFGGIIADAFVFNPARHMIEFQAVVWSLAAVLVGICYWKGEPARWRWGK